MQLTQVKKLLLRVCNSLKELWSFRPDLHYDGLSGAIFG